jgi:carotenoid cleavage dioxygenase-like enzyme
MQVDGSTLYKHDFQVRRHETRSFGAGQGVSEFVFVPSVPGSPEDQASCGLRL